MKRIMGSHPCAIWLVAAFVIVMVALGLCVKAVAFENNNEVPHKDRYCPVCGDNMRFISEEYGAWTHEKESRLCAHKDTNNVDIEASRMIIHNYICDSCAGNCIAAYDSGIRQRGWHCLSTGEYVVEN